MEYSGIIFTEFEALKDNIHKSHYCNFLVYQSVAAQLGINDNSGCYGIIWLKLDVFLIIFKINEVLPEAETDLNVT